MSQKEKEMIVLSRVLDVFVDIDVFVDNPANRFKATVSISIGSLPTSIMQIYLKKAAP